MLAIYENGFSSRNDLTHTNMCVQANFPRIDVHDRPLIKRLKAISMRGLFLTAHELQQRELLGGTSEHVFLLEDHGFKERLNVDARMAHMHKFVAAYDRYLGDGKSFGLEPACVQELVDQIVQTSDPRVNKALEFIDERINFTPVRTPEFFSKKYYAWITQKELLDSYWHWYTDPTNEDNAEFRRDPDNGKDAKSEWKKIIEVVMKGKGRNVSSFRATIDGQQKDLIAYDHVAWVS